MLKKGKEEIVYLLGKCIEKFKQETNQKIILNTNRKNYESLAITLSEISNKLPVTSESLGHQPYEADFSPQKKDYPFRKYDITGGQIKDALMGLVSNPRPYMVDTCYIYIYGMGRKAFEANPVDNHLIKISDANDEKGDAFSIYVENQQLKENMSQLLQDYEQQSRTNPFKNGLRKKLKHLYVFSISFFILFLVVLGFLIREVSNASTLRNDLNLLPYKVTNEESTLLAGIWICYTGSPQARLSDSSRFHKVVSNIIKIEYKNGYFVYERFGASFNHTGYIQFEAPGLLSIHSKVKNNDGTIESPRHSLMILDTLNTYLTAISASWNFDVGNRNRIIGIREVYKKLGNDGELLEVINSIENASCQCKIIQWTKPDKTMEKFYLKNVLLSELPDTTLRKLLDEKSILLKNPEEKLVVERR